MSLFDFIRKLLGNNAACPKCGYGSSWDGQRCIYCHHQATASDPPNTDNRNDAAETGSEPQQTSTSLSGLSTEKFAPISTDEALDLTQGSNWRTAYLDSMSIIPPADLPRIKVINQTMVGLGLISPEELTQIHAVGEEFSKYKSEYQQIRQAGVQAVTQSRQQRAEHKRQKKEEAAARKKAHQDAVAQRKANDIVFLGRGVSKGLANRQSHIEKLSAAGLPLLATPAEFANAIGVSIPQLKWLAFHSVAATQVHYVNFTVPKKSGGLRTLSAPHQKLASVQRWIFENVLQKVPVHDAANGFVTGRSVITNAQPHVGTDVVVNVDLKDFFPSITFFRIEGLFRSLGYSPAVATIMALLCSECPRRQMKYAGQVYHVATGPRGLPQGACTSPTISNLVTRHLDVRFTAMAKKLHWNYTRYADDMTFSTKQPDPAIGYLLARIRHISDDEGFRVNEKKTRVLRRHARQMVTGVVVNDQLSIDRRTVRKLRAILHNAKTTGLEAQNREEIPHFSAWVLGMIAWVESVHPKQGMKLRSQFDQLVGR